MPKEEVHPMGGLIRLLAAASVTVSLVSCVNTSDQRMIEAAESLVPPGSEVTDVRENTGVEGLVGTYRVHLTISAGGAGEELDEAISEQARSSGWTLISEEQIPAGTRLSYARDGFRADISVRTENATINAVIRVEEAET